METLQLTKYQARQAINTWKYAQDDLQHKDLNYVERQAATYDEKYDNIKEVNGVFLWIRKSEGDTYTLPRGKWLSNTDYKIYEGIVKIDCSTYFIKVK